MKCVSIIVLVYIFIHCRNVFFVHGLTSLVVLWKGGGGVQLKISCQFSFTSNPSWWWGGGGAHALKMHRQTCNEITTFGPESCLRVLYVSFYPQTAKKHVIRNQNLCETSSLSSSPGNTISIYSIINM